MARVTTCTCDRCGEEVKDSELHSVSVTISVGPTQSDTRFQRRELELCSGCLTRLGAGEDDPELVWLSDKAGFIGRIADRCAALLLKDDRAS